MIDGRDAIILSKDEAQKLLDAINDGGWTTGRIEHFRELGLWDTVDSFRRLLNSRRAADADD